MIASWLNAQQPRAGISISGGNEYVEQSDFGSEPALTGQIDDLSAIYSLYQKPNKVIVGADVLPKFAHSVDQDAPHPAPHLWTEDIRAGTWHRGGLTLAQCDFPNVDAVRRELVKQNSSEMEHWTRGLTAIRLVKRTHALVRKIHNLLKSTLWALMTRVYMNSTTDADIHRLLEENRLESHSLAEYTTAIKGYTEHMHEMVTTTSVVVPQSAPPPSSVSSLSSLPPPDAYSPLRGAPLLPHFQEHRNRASTPSTPRAR